MGIKCCHKYEAVVTEAGEDNCRGEIKGFFLHTCTAVQNYVYRRVSLKGNQLEASVEHVLCGFTEIVRCTSTFCIILRIYHTKPSLGLQFSTVFLLGMRLLKINNHAHSLKGSAQQQHKYAKFVYCMAFLKAYEISLG